MRSRVYYGEYSLRHWINLMLTRNIELPEYQRSFVWSEKDIQRLIKSLDEGQFVQPITIAHYICNGKEKNLILDGQQRLTSILLALIGYMPDKKVFNEDVDIASGDDSMEDSDSDDSKKRIGWTFENIVDADISKNDPNRIKEEIRRSSKYIKINIEIDKNSIDVFLDTTFLGFSYIIPMEDDSSKTQNFFSTLFRNMNYLGKKLSSLESRRSLYYQNEKLNKFFEGITSDDKDVLCNIGLLENMQNHRIDFVRYLSILSQFKAKNGDCKKVLVGYSSYSSRESYYADYVSYIVGLEQESRTNKFDDFYFDVVFAGNCWINRFNEIRNTIEKIKDKMCLDMKKNAFTSWIDADYWLFGLLYWVLFEGKSILYDTTLLKLITKEISSKRDGGGDYSKNPNRLGNLRDRLQASVNLYKDYAK